MEEKKNTEVTRRSRAQELAEAFTQLPPDERRSRLLVLPYYSIKRDEILEPDNVVQQFRYFWDKWVPVGSAFAYAGSGGGAGFGYVQGDGQKRCWTTGDGEVWAPFSVEFQVAVEPIFDSGKAGNVRILERPDPANVTVSPNAVVAARESMSTLSVAPNPFNPQTQVKFALARAGVVRLDVFDLRGARVRTLVDEPMEAGMHEIAWDGRNEAGTRVASGVYVVKLESGTLRQTASLVLLQ